MFNCIIFFSVSNPAQKSLLYLDILKNNSFCVHLKNSTLTFLFFLGLLLMQNCKPHHLVKFLLLLFIFILFAPHPSQQSAQNIISSVQFSSVAQSCPTLCDPMNHSTPGLPVYHQLLESTQTHVHCVSDAIQPSHPLSSPSPPALNLFQHQGLFK